MTEEVARYQPGQQLLQFIERAGIASGRVLAADAARRREAHGAAVREQARLSARLDGSPLDDDTVARVDADGGSPPPATYQDDSPAGGWASALRIEGLPTQDIAGREYANLLATARIEQEVAATFFEQPLQALTNLHAAICEGLVAPSDIGRFRRTERAIHDGAQGQMLWAAPPPERIPALMDALLDWLGGRSADNPTLVVAAIAHERILEWQPFEAANGRLARSVARVIRRARGLDPHGLAVPERLWQQHTMAYHREVAATMRRRGDLTRWIERVAHAEAVALEAAADSLTSTRAAAVSQTVTELLAASVGDSITPVDVAAQLGVSRERARSLLDEARRAGLVTEDVTAPVPRFRVVAGSEGSLSDGAG